MQLGAVVGNLPPKGKEIVKQIPKIFHLLQSNVDYSIQFPSMTDSKAYLNIKQGNKR